MFAIIQKAGYFCLRIPYNFFRGMSIAHFYLYSFKFWLAWRRQKRKMKASIVNSRSHDRLRIVLLPNMSGAENLS